MRPFLAVKFLAVLLAILSPVAAIGDARTDELRLCLNELGGIQWQLPFSPPIHILACVTPKAAYDAEKSTDGSRRLELIGELTLGPEVQLPSDDTYAALQAATFAHFDALFQRHGYRRVEVQHGNAQTKYDRATIRMLSGERPGREDEVEPPELPAIPFVKLARYVRPAPGGEFRLTYRSEARNTWRIEFDQPTSAPASAAIAK